MIKTTALAVLITAALGASFTASAASQKNLSCYQGQRNPLAAPEIEQFEFLIGAFESKLYPWNPETGDWAEEPIRDAFWEGEYMLDGTGIVDYWYSADPAKTPDTGRGVNIRVYDPKAGEWNMAWTTWGTNFTTLVLKAKMIDGVLTMWQVYPGEEEPEVSEFISKDEDHWTRYTYKVDGENRQPYFKIDSARIPCDR